MDVAEVGFQRDTDILSLYQWGGTLKQLGASVGTSSTWEKSSWSLLDRVSLKGTVYGDLFCLLAFQGAG